MIFLPIEDIEIAWLCDEREYPQDGHAWYGGQYCIFELDCCQCAPGHCDTSPVYILYSLKGDTLVHELARRKWLELGADSTRFANVDHELLVGGTKKRPDDLGFIGRFVGMRPHDQSIESGSIDDWILPVQSSVTRNELRR